MRYIKKKILNCIGILFFISIILIYMKLWISVDEYYTLNLIHKSYSGLIYVDSFDVHPPLYYIILKLLVNNLLFFKHSVLLEIIIGRLFSVIVSIISIHYLIKINRHFGIYLNKVVQYLIYIILPNVIFADNMNLSPFNNIRMYALASLFVILTWYFILKFNSSNEYRYLFLLSIFAIFSSYTHYYSALISGLFILSYFLLYLFNKNYFKSFLYLLSGISMIICYIPWILYGLIRQFHILSYEQPIYKSLIQSFTALFIILIFIFPIMHLIKKLYYKKKFDLKILCIINVFILFSTSFYSIIKSPIFLIRYLFPSIIIFEFISLSYIIYSFRFNIKHKLLKKIFVLFIFLISICSLFHESIKVLPISYFIYKNDKFFSSDSKYVDISSSKYFVPTFNINNSSVNYDTQYAIYLRSIGKIPYLKNQKRIYYDKFNKSYPSRYFMPDLIDYKHNGSIK